MQGTDHIIPPTDLPCPAWGQLRAGHGFDSDDPGTGHAIRHHERVIADLEWKHLDRATTPGRCGRR
jgi:hypothetical protein